MTAGDTPTEFAPAERFDDCIHCGLCLDACPTYVESGLEADSPRGRLYLMRALGDGSLPLTRSTVRHLDLCLGCRACETACPSGVAYGALIEAARPAIEGRHRRPLAARLRREIVARLVADPDGQPWFLRASALLPRRPLAALARFGALPAGLQFRLALAAVAPRPTVTRLPERLEPRGPVRGTVVLFAGCLAHALFGPTNARAAELLRLAGFRVLVPAEPLCCGALLLHLGRARAARRHARRALAALAAFAADAVVVTAAGCAATLRGYEDLLGPAAAPVARRTRDVLALLAETPLPPAPRPVPVVATYHDACHLAHAQGVREEPRRLLRTVPGLTLVELDEADRCCGSAGSYNLTEPGMALRLLDRKIARVRATGATLVTAANPGCILQIRAGLLAAGASRTVVAHPMDVLAAAHGVGPPPPPLSPSPGGSLAG
jgi:glycolate oxidase iron-sulfur subunit